MDPVRDGSELGSDSVDGSLPVTNLFLVPTGAASALVESSDCS